MSNKGFKWYNNGVKQIMLPGSEIPPEGFKRGCLPHPEEQNKKHSEYLKEAYRTGKLVNPKKGVKDTPEQIEVKRKRALGKKMSEEAKRKISLAFKGKRKPDGFGEKVSKRMKGNVMSEETKRKLSEKLKGKPISKDVLEERNRKQFETKRKNGTFNSSKSEKLYYSFLTSVLGETNVKQQFSGDSRYPFASDIYIPFLDLFIELNLFMTHGPHPYGTDEVGDELLLNVWRERQSTYINHNGIEVKNQYYSYENVFKNIDPKKLSYIKNNKLNCILIYDSEIFLYQRGILVNALKSLKPKEFLYDLNILRLALQRLASINGWTVIPNNETGVNEFFKADGTKVTAEEIKVGSDKLIQYYYTMQWDGILPETYVGDGSASTLILGN